MPHFKIKGKPVSVPDTWADVPRDVLPQLVACRLEKPTQALKLRWLQHFTGTTPAVLARIDAEMVRRLAGLLDWIWQGELPGGLMTDFAHEGQRFYLVEPTLNNCTLGEYIVADHHLRQFLQQQQVQSLPQLVAAVCRPERRGLDRTDANWDGDERELFNARIAQDRAGSMATLPIGIQQLVLAHFLAAQTHLFSFYSKLFTTPGGGSGGHSEEAGTSPLIDLAYSLADAGVFGTFEQVCRENIYTVLEYLESGLRRHE